MPASLASQLPFGSMAEGLCQAGSCSILVRKRGMAALSVLAFSGLATPHLGQSERVGESGMSQIEHRIAFFPFVD